MLANSFLVGSCGILGEWHCVFVVSVCMCLCNYDIAADRKACANQLFPPSVSSRRREPYGEFVSTEELKLRSHSLKDSNLLNVSTM